MNPIRFSAVAVALIAAVAAIGTAQANPRVGGGVYVPQVSAPRGGVPMNYGNPGAAAAGSAVTAGRDAASAGNPGGKLGLIVPSIGSGMPNVAKNGGEVTDAMVAAQQTKVDSISWRVEDLYDSMFNSPYMPSGELARAANHEQLMAGNAEGAQSEYQQAKEKYLNDPTPENEALRNAAEKELIKADKEADTAKARVKELSNQIEAAKKAGMPTYNALKNQAEKEQAKLKEMKIKNAQAQGSNTAVNNIVDNLLSP